MTDKQLIHHMETWILFEAQKKWKKTPNEIAEIFKKYEIFSYISECYDYLHLSSYQCALEEVERLLQNKGYVEKAYG